MRPEHRHQLKTNELAEWIVNFPQWAKENSRTIIYLSVLAVVVGGLYFWKRYEEKVVSVRKQLGFTSSISQLLQGKAQILRAQAQGVDTAYTLIQAADNFRSIAQDVKNDEMAALALIKRAEALRTELHYRFGSIDRQNLTAQIKLAKDSYTEAIEKASNNKSLVAMAKLGLGLCEEELGNFKKAREIYNEMIMEPDSECTVAAAQAKQRLHVMADYRQDVVFRKSSKKAQKAIEVMPPEIKLETPQGHPSQMGPFETPDVNLGARGPNSTMENPDFNLSG